MADLNKKIDSYHALLVLGRINDLTDGEWTSFNLETNLHFSELSEVAQKKVLKIRDQQPSQHFRGQYSNPPDDDE
ncbi:MAG: hypothetical protein V1934_05600 [Methanobacteriota archaeon]